MAIATSRQKCGDALREHRTFSDDMRIEFTAVLSRGIRQWCSESVRRRASSGDRRVCGTVQGPRSQKLPARIAERASSLGPRV